MKPLDWNETEYTIYMYILYSIQNRMMGYIKVLLCTLFVHCNFSSLSLARAPNSNENWLLCKAACIYKREREKRVVMHLGLYIISSEKKCDPYYILHFYDGIYMPRREREKLKMHEREKGFSQRRYFMMTMFEVLSKG